MEFFILGFIIGGVLALAVSSIIHESAEGTAFGQELQAMRRASAAEPTELAEVRLIYRGVPSDDSGPDLL